MSKRIIYLLATLLIAESAIPLSAQSLGGQTRTYSAINTNYVQTTTGGGIVVDPPTTTGPGIDVPTTGPAITVKQDKIYATDLASARARVDFTLHNLALKPEYVEQAYTLHVVLDTNTALTSVTPDGTPTNEPIGTLGGVTIWNSNYFIFEFKATDIDPSSIKANKNVTFKLPVWLFTSEKELKGEGLEYLEVTVPIEQDQVNKPVPLLDSTTSSGTKLVTLNCDTEYSEIRYTLDGSDVTLGSPLYNGTPITLSSSDTLRATAFVGTMPSEEIVVTYDNIPEEEDGSSNGDSGSNEDSSSNGDSGSNGDSVSNGDSDSNGDSSSNGDSNSGGDSSSNGSSSTEVDNTTEDSDQVTSDTTNPPTDSNSMPDTVSDTVMTLIKQQERNLTTKTTEAAYGLTINNQKVELKNKLLVSNGRTLAPLRTIAEALNIPIHYHAASKTAIIKTEDKLIEFPLGYNVAIVNGEMIQIDTSDATVMSTIQDGRTYLPVRFIAEQLNLNIEFDGEQVHMNSVK